MQIAHTEMGQLKTMAGFVTIIQGDFRTNLKPLSKLIAIERL